MQSDPTIKETIMIQNYKGNIENNRNNYMRSKNMEMKPTIKETTLFSHVGQWIIINQVLL